MASSHLPNGMGSSLSRVMSPVEPTALLDAPIIAPFSSVYTLVFRVNLFFLPGYDMRRNCLSEGRCAGQCVPSMNMVPPSGPGTILLNSSLVSHSDIWRETLAAVGSVAKSILSMTRRYLHTAVWSVPNSASSVPCVGLSFLRISAMSRACRRDSLHLFPGSDALVRSSRNSGSSPLFSRNARACSSTCWNFSLSISVAEWSFASSPMMSSKTSTLCSAAADSASPRHPSSRLFHRLRSSSRSVSFRTSFLSLCSRTVFSFLSFRTSFLSLCSRTVFSFLFSCCNLRMI